MSDKRYLGNIITPTPTAPAGPYQDDAAKGVWSLQEAYTYIKAGTWPTAGNRLERALMLGGDIGLTYQTTIASTSFATSGNYTDVGDLTVARRRGAVMSSTSRAVYAGGSTGSNLNVIDFITYSSLGTATDFGDTLSAGIKYGGCGNDTRGLIGGGEVSGVGTVNTIEYITIASAGNSTDFGDLDVAIGGIPANSAMSSTTRGIWFGGQGSGGTRYNVIQYVTIATTGNATDFGDLLQQKNSVAGCSNATRGVMAGGEARTNVIQYITLATTGNATDFGDLYSPSEQKAASSNSVYALFAAGEDDISVTNRVDYITIATTGNSVEFGDALAAITGACGTSNAHGGLS